MAGVVCLAYRSCGVHEQWWICMACWSVSYVVNFCFCWTWHIWVVIYVEGCWVSSACWCVVMCSFSRCEYTNVHVESFVVCIIGKMAQDVGMM